MKQMDQELSWLGSLELGFRDCERIDSEIKRAKKDFEDFLQLKTREKEQIESKFGFMRKILVATEDTALDRADRLSASVAQGFEFIGFEVQDVSDEVRQVLGKDGCWIRHQDYMAITEIAATVEKNMTLRDYANLLGRMVILSQRRDLVPDSDSLRGLLIANYDSLTTPFERPQFYEGKDAEIVEEAKQHRIGLLSTVELYKIAVAVKDSLVSKVDAIELLKQPGRIRLDLNV